MSILISNTKVKKFCPSKFNFNTEKFIALEQRNNFWQISFHLFPPPLAGEDYISSFQNLGMDAVQKRSSVKQILQIGDISTEVNNFFSSL